jgi:hypothetical protein
MTPRAGSTLVAISALLLGACGEGGSSPGGTTPSGGTAGSGATSSSAGTPATMGGSSSSGSSMGGSSNGGEQQSAGSSGSPTGGTGGGGGTPSQSGIPDDATVILFLVDGLQQATLDTGIANGATNMKFLVDNGVTSETSYSTSPAARLELPPNNSLPWGNATSGNVAVHTGCHLHESSMMDDIFLAAGAAGIVSVFSGGDANYSAFTNPDFEYADDFEDAEVMGNALDHIENDDARLIRLHFQRIRDDWSGPAGETMANSAYVQHLIAIDGLLGELRAALEAKGVWERTYIILTADHGMGQSGSSDHPPNVRSSWENVAVFYGPGVKKGATIPYSENPDMAILANHLLKLPPLQGHTDPQVTLTNKGPTGTLLTNIFEGGADVVHPRYVEQYLNTNTYMSGGTGYSDYRLGMLEILE